MVTLWGGELPAHLTGADSGAQLVIGRPREKTMADQDNTQLTFVTCGPQVRPLTEQEQRENDREVEAWRTAFRALKIEMQQVTCEDLRIRAR